MEIKLRNATTAVSKVGFAVVIDPRDPNSFIYAPANATSILGIVKEAKPYRELCEITINGEALVYVNGNAVKGNTIRTAKSTDRTSLGTCLIAKTGDAPYLKIGEAVGSGKGLVRCVLNFAYLFTDGDALTVSDITDIDTTYLRLNQTAQQATIGTFKFPIVATTQVKSNSDAASDITLVTGADKTLVFDTVTWDDSMVSPTSFRSGGTALTFDLLTASIYTHRFDVNDEIHIAVQFPHSIKVNTIISPHIHIINKNAIGASNYNVAFDFKWTWANIGSAYPAEQQQLNVKQSFQNASALTHKMLVFNDITPVAGQGNISSIFLAMLKRVAADSEPYNTADIYSLGFDVHFQKDTVGSRFVGAK